MGHKGCLWAVVGGEGFVRETPTVEATLGIETVKSGRTAHKDDLMLSSAIESLAARPERLVGKSEKFYRVTAFNTVSALREMERRRNTADELDVEKLLDWLAEIWLDPEVRQEIAEPDWLRFYESIQGYNDALSK